MRYIMLARLAPGVLHISMELNFGPLSTDPLETQLLNQSSRHAESTAEIFKKFVKNAQ